MLKQKLKAWAPTKEQLQKYKFLNLFGSLLYNQNLWHLNRYSTAKAFAVGLFFAWIPVPFQMLLAAAMAIVVRSNLPISVALVWLTNPITMPPLFYFSYRIGVLVLQVPPKPFVFELSAAKLVEVFGDKLQPFLVGCLICAVMSAIIGYIAVLLLWRYFVVKNWLNRVTRKAQ